MPVENIISTLRKNNAPPSLLGFGVSSAEQVKEAIKLGADGAISGSAVVKIIQDNLNNSSQLLNELGSFIFRMKEATSK